MTAGWTSRKCRICWRWWMWTWTSTTLIASSRWELLSPRARLVSAVRPLGFWCITKRSASACSFLPSQMADKSQSGTLEDDEFVFFYKMLTQREDVLRVFQEYSVDGQKLSLSDLEDFLREEQLEGGDIEQHAKQLIECYEPSETGNGLTVRNVKLWRETYQVSPWLDPSTVLTLSLPSFQPSCWMPWHLTVSWCTWAQLRAPSSTHSGGVSFRTWASLCAITSSPPLTTLTWWRTSSEDRAV